MGAPPLLVFQTFVFFELRGDHDTLESEAREGARELRRELAARGDRQRAGLAEVDDALVVGHHDGWALGVAAVLVARRARVLRAADLVAQLALAPALGRTGHGEALRRLLC